MSTVREPTQLDEVARARRRELSDFLRTRRARLRPKDLGLRSGGRRRTPGLRREEVAALAGISTSWYTWLEQGRDVRVSPDLVHDLSEALRLDLDERCHLLKLAFGELCGGLEEPPPPALAQRHEQLLRTLEPSPAALVDPRADLLGQNCAWALLLPRLASTPPQERNFLRFIFTDAQFRDELQDWEAFAADEVARWRFVHPIGDRRAERIVRLLQRVSPEFTALWERHDLHRAVGDRLVISHATTGRIALEAFNLQLSELHGVILFLAVPADEDATRRLAGLARASSRA